MTKLMIKLMPILFIFPGCMKLASPEGRHEGRVDQKGPVINIPLAELINDKVIKTTAEKTADRAAENAAAKTANAVTAQIDTKMKTVQDNITGLVTAKVEEIGKLLDIKADLSAKIENKMYASLESSIKNNMSAVANLQNNMNASLENTMTFRADMKTQLKAFSDINAKMVGQVDGITGQAGFNNKISKTLETVQQDIRAQAGRDVNMLPPQAVEVMMNQNKTFYWTIIGILAVIMAITLSAMLYIYRNSRLREENRTKLLMIALGKMDPNDAEEIKRSL